MAGAGAKTDRDRGRGGWRHRRRDECGGCGTRGTRRVKTEEEGEGEEEGLERSRCHFHSSAFLFPLLRHLFFPSFSPFFIFFSLPLSLSPLLPRRLYSQQLGISQATLDIVFAASRVSFSLEILSAPRRASPSLSPSPSSSSFFLSLSISVASAAGIACARRRSPLRLDTGRGIERIRATRRRSLSLPSSRSF